jgi:Fe(3+) dicitrate transport protein
MVRRLRRQLCAAAAAPFMLLAFGNARIAAAAAQEPSGTVAGQVRATSGSPLENVLVRLEREGSSPDAPAPRVDSTDAAGRFAFAAVPAGSYVVSFERSDFVARQVRLEATGTSQLNIVLAAAPVAASAQELDPVIVTGAAPAPPPLIGRLPDVRGTELFAGKKTEVVQVDSLTVNTAQDVSRQLLARLPGANITESANSGFPSNGLGFRGLNPVQSVEMNVRQDGVNIVADIYGYPETYYTPPAEAVERLELIRGSSSLQFGPQFGGVVNYVLRDGTPNTPLSIRARETGGSFGMFNSYLSLEGGSGALTYFAYGQYRGQQGWRPNSDLSQVAAAGKLSYRPSSALTMSLEYSLLRNRIHMPGGLDDEQFNDDPRSSNRSRNWLASPWNVLALKADARLSPSTRLTSTLSYMNSQRYLVWRNEDGGAAAPDDVDPATLQRVPREVERERFTNVTNETRLAHSYSLFGNEHSLATGFRVFAGELGRQEGGPGTTGSDFDMSLVGGPYETDLRFDNVNAAAFVENEFRIGTRLSLTPGLRVEYLHSTAHGHSDTTVTPRAKDRTFLLAGVGAQLQASAHTDIYANVTQAYRPIEYSFLTPFASLTRIDPDLKDPKGYNADIGWRGSLGDALRFDVGVFNLVYHDRIGLISGEDASGAPFTERTNVATSVHRGVESYVGVSLSSLLGLSRSFGTLDVFDALGYTHARYTTGDLAGNRVELAPEVINRAGGTYARGRGSLGVQWSYVSRQFTDANNTVASDDANVGIIPAHQVVDLSARWQLTHTIGLDAGVNNVADHRYFTMRTSEYPGPGIIPALGRSFYFGARVGF